MQKFKVALPPERLAELNHDFFVVRCIGVGRCRVCWEVPHPTEPDRVVVFTNTFPEFQRRFASDNEGALWLDHPLRRTYDRIIYCPPSHTMWNPRHECRVHAVPFYVGGRRWRLVERAGEYA